MKIIDKKKLYINSIIVLSIFLIDRIFKIFVIKLNNESYANELYLSKFLNIQLIWNEGIAFGLLSFEQKNLYNIVTIIILIIILGIIYMIINSNGLKMYSLLMILGGALGNAFDRLFYKAVPDFIDLHLGDLHWFIFNIADIFISLGVIFMILLELIGINEKRYD